MQNQSSNKTVFLAAGIIIVLVAGYFVFFKGKDKPDDTLTSTPGAPGQLGITGAKNPGADLLPYLAQLNSLQLNGAIFNSAAYKSLQDYTIVILEQPKGRPNPFAPVPKEAKASATTKRTNIQLPRR